MPKCDICDEVVKKRYPIITKTGETIYACWNCFKEYYKEKKIIPISKIVDEQKKIPKINMKGEIKTEN